MSILFFAMYNGIGPVPTSLKVKQKLLEHMTMPGPVVELGAGWGTLLVPIAKARPNERVIGYENSWLCYLFLKIRTWRLPNVQIYCKNFWKADLTGPAIYVCYLYPAAMKRLKDKLVTEEGSWVVSHTFAIPGWQAQLSCQADDLYKTPIYYYQI